MPMIGCRYKSCIGRIILDNIEFFRSAAKIRFLGNCIKKKNDKLEVYILTLNSTNQNDLLSGLNFGIDFKKIIIKTLNQIYFKKILKSTQVFQLFIQKVISGNSFQLNKYLLNNILIKYSPKLILKGTVKYRKILGWYDFIIHFDTSSSKIVPFFRFFFNKSGEKVYINYILNKKLSNLPLTKGFTSLLKLNSIPFMINCPLFISEFFFFKLCLFYQLTEEHFLFRIYQLSSKNNYKVSKYSMEKNFKEYFYNILGFFDILIILQSIESMPFNCRILSFKILILCRDVLYNNSKCHPLIKCITQRLRSNFYF